MTQSLDTICQSGSFLNSFVYHVSGLPWAACTSVEFTDFLNTNSTDAQTLKSKMFGSDTVTVLTILDTSLGSQKVSYDESKGLNVGNWGVKLSPNSASFKWNNGTNIDQWGVIGLDWQPVETTPGAGFSVLSADLDPDYTDHTCVVSWPKDKDNGISKWLFDHRSSTAHEYDMSLYLYVGSSCLLVTSWHYETSGTYKVSVTAGQFNAPIEHVQSLKNRQNIYLTNYPQGIEGITANLYGALYDNELLSGTTPVLLRTGKIKSNASNSSGGQWSINMGGFTDQLKFKIGASRFKGRLSGYWFNTVSNTGTKTDNAYSMPALVVREYKLLWDTVNTATFNVGTHYDSISDVISDLVYQMNASAYLDCVYENTGDDITWSPDGSNIASVAVAGSAPFVCGLGFVMNGLLGQYFKSLADPINNSIAPILKEKFEFPKLGTPGAMFFELRLSSGDSTATFRNEAKCDYFIQRDLFYNNHNWGHSQNLIALENGYSTSIKTGSGTAYLTILKDESSELDIIEGAKLMFGNWSDMGGVISGKVDTVTGNTIEFVADQIKGAPSAFYTSTNIYDLIKSNDGYRDRLSSAIAYDDNIENVNAIQELFTNRDNFEVVDSTESNANNPVDYFKDLLGDQTISTGLSKSVIQTSIKNVIDQNESNFLPLINWQQLKNLINENAIKGVEYVFNLKKQSVNLMSMLNAVCITHNIQMTWGFNSDYNTWIMSFKKVGAGNQQDVLTFGRMIKPANIAINSVSAITGGGWYYSEIKCEYLSINNKKIKISERNRDGRIGHSLRDKTLTIKDTVTRLPIEFEDAQNDIIFNYSNLLKLFSTVLYKQSLQLNLTLASRLIVGESAGVNWIAMLDREKGRRNTGDKFGELSSYDLNLSTGIISVSLNVNPLEKLAISGSLNADTLTKSSNTITIKNVSKNTDDNLYATSPHTDLSMFGCFDVINNTLVERADSGAFRVTILERNPVNGRLYLDTSYTATNQNVWRGTMRKIELSDVTGAGYVDVTIELDGNSAAFDIYDDYVVIFADRSDSQMQDYQIQNFGWLGDATGLVIDSDGNKTAAIKVGS